jgi:hypothetical protein
MARQHLVENFSKDWKEPLIVTKLPLTESNSLVESDGKQYKAIEGYEVPVWRLGVKNLNERVYSEALGRKVIKEFGGLITANLSDHPKEDGSVSDILSVAKNPHIKEGILYVDAFVVDEAFAKKLNKMHEAGYGLGVSSSCYGDLNESTGEVLEEGFEVDRFFDWVLTPSYSVFVTGANRKEYKEEIENKPTNIIEETKSENIELDKVQKENSIMSDKLTSLEEKNLKLGIKSLFEKAEAKVDLKEKLASYNEILEYCEGVEFAAPYVESANSEIAKIAEATHVLAEKGKLLEGVEKEKASLEEKAKTTEKAVDEATGTLSKVSENFEKAVKMLDAFKLREGKLKEMYEIAIAERNGMIEASEYKELAEKYDEIEGKLEDLIDENAKLSKMTKKYKNRILQLEADAEEADEEDEDDEEEEKAKEEATRNRKRNRREGGGLANLGDKKAEPFDAEDAKEARGEKDDDDSEDKDEKKEEGRIRRQYDTSSIREDDEDGYDFTEGEEIREYVNELLEQNPANKRIKNQLLKCKTLFEAQKTYLDLMDLVEDSPSPYKPRMNEGKTYGGIQVSSESPRNNLVRKGWR